MATASTPLAPSVARSRTSSSPMARREALMFYLLISPWLVGFVLLVAGPVIASLVLSFTQWDLANPPTWVGPGNYITLFTSDKLFFASLRVTGIWVLIGVPLRLVVSLIVALLLNQQIRAMGFFRTVYYLPSVVSGVAVALLWVWVLQPQYGLLNELLRMLGLPTPSWLGSEEWALPAFIMMSLWGTGATMVIFLAGLQGIPLELYEAADIDGAGLWRKFTNVTMPLITPVLLFNLITGIIASFQVFAQAFIMTNGGPNNATLFYVLYLYRVAFQYSQMGYASAMAWILFIIVLACTLAVFRWSQSWVHYEGDVRGRAK